MPKRSKREPADKGQSLNSILERAFREDYQEYLRTEVPGFQHGHRQFYNEQLQREAFLKARFVAKASYWLKSFLKLKRSVVNYGFVLNPVSGKTKALDAWLSKKVPRPEVGDINNPNIGVPGGFKTYREQIAKFVKDSIMDHTLFDSVIAYWANKQRYAICLPHENLRYRDVFGVETLFFTNKLTPEQLELLPPELAVRFKQAHVPIAEEYGEFFKVLKDERDGFGLPWPAVQSIFRTLATIDSMELSESAYAYTGRLHWRHHKLGHEIKNNANAGKPTHFWNKARGKAVLAAFKDKGGNMGDFTSNFDHIIEYPHEDEKFFNAQKWESPEHRLTRWGGPLAEMVLRDGVTPFTTQLLKADITDTRADLKIFLDAVINEAWDLPTEVEVIWSDAIFNDINALLQLLQFGVSAGAVSQSTFRQVAGFNDAEEEQKKETEAADFKKNPQKYKPAYDPAHGDPNAKGGAPRGNVNSDHA